MARQVLENGVILPAEYSDDWYDDMTSNLTKLDDVIGSDSEKLSSADVGAAALSNNYNDLDNLPTIPTVNDATLTIQKNGVDVQTFTANASSNVTCNITVPTKTSDLTNDSNFVDTSNAAVASGITSSKVTDYDAHIADTDIHVTTADKTKWNNGVSQAFVFRYSSTALVASSTNSNTLLDNTDNLKVGDKVIDSSGVLFSITAIDTANSTFTIGTALIDLAQDSDVVHKSGNETVGGNKTFSDDIIRGSVNTNSTIQARNLIGKTTASTIGSDSNSYQSITATLNYSDSTPSKSVSVSLYVNENAYADGKYNAFYPGSNNVVNLGISGKRWANVYATNYYYGSNNVEFSTKFVTTDTNQTITGTKTFENVNIQLKSTNAEYSVSGGYSSVSFHDKNLLELSRTRLGIYSSGFSYIKQTILGYDSNNQQVDATITFSWSSLTKPFIRPDSDNLVSLGTSGNRWAGVYATNYYYGSNNVEFSTKFVTTDTAQTVSGAKTFSSDLYVANTDTTANTPNLNLKNYKADRGTTDTAVQSISFLDKNAKALTLLESRRVSNGNTATNILCYNTDDSNNTVSGGVAIIKSKTDTNFAPNADNAVTCGRALAKWSDVQTYKINALEPSSLSLPSDRSARIDISSYFIYTGNNATNDYSVLANGYIFLKLNNINQITCYSTDSSSITNYAQTYTRPSDGVLYITFPVRKNDNFRTIWNTGSSVSVESAYFIPCQGNV